MRLNTVQRAIVEALSEECGYGIQNVQKALEDLIEEIVDYRIDDLKRELEVKIREEVNQSLVNHTVDKSEETA